MWIVGEWHSWGFSSCCFGWSWGLSSSRCFMFYADCIMRGLDPHVKTLIYFIGGRRHCGCRVWALGLLCTFTPIQFSRWGQREGPPHIKAYIEIYFIGGRRHSGSRAMSLGPPIPLHKQAQRICAFCIHFRLKHNPLAQLACHHGSQGHEPYESDEAIS